MLNRYKTHFESLDATETTIVACAIAQRHPGTIGPMGMCSPSGAILHDICSTVGLSQADVVMSMASDPTAQGVVILEKLIGKPIVRAVERSASAPATRTKRADGAPRGNAVKKTDPRVIEWICDNPKKPGSASHARFALYTVGMTVSEFVAAGGTTADVKWDTEHGFVKLEESK